MCPVLESKWIFFDGGDDGEQVTRRIIEESPRYLRPGGTLYCLAMASDRVERPLEQRIREWLRAGAGEFDVAVVVRRMIDPREFAFDSLARGAGGCRRGAKMEGTFRIAARDFPSLRHDDGAAQGGRPRAIHGARRQAGRNTMRVEHQWLLDWETAAASQTEAVFEHGVDGFAYCELLTLSRMNERRLGAEGYNLASGQPFRMEMKIDPGSLICLRDAMG